MSDAVLLAIDGPIARITLNRPDKLNALDLTSACALRDVLHQLHDNAQVRVVGLAGAGRAFQAGGDISAFREDAPRRAAELIEPVHECIRLMATLPVPVVASLHGAVAGAGVSLALAADLAIAAADTKFTLSYARIGTSPDAGATWHLPRVVGLRKAMEIALLADGFDAAEALRLSLVNRVVPADALAAETDALLTRLAQGPTAAYGRIKRLLHESDGRTLPQQLDAETAAFVASAGTADFAEGMSAFFGKRPPQYRGY